MLRARARAGCAAPHRRRIALPVVAAASQASPLAGGAYGNAPYDRGRVWKTLLKNDLKQLQSVVQLFHLPQYKW